jgi:hypothetical protein
MSTSDRFVEILSGGKVRKTALGITFALSVLCHPAIAEPTPSVNALMNEKLSLFEFGMYKMEKSLDNFTPRLKKEWNFDGFNTVGYNWKKNQIEILWFGFNFRPQNACGGVSVEKCRDITSKIWQLARDSICPTSKCDKTSHMAGWFSHRGFERKLQGGRTDNEIAEDLIHIVYQKVSQGVKNDDGKNQYITCEGPITEKTPACKVD